MCSPTEARRVPLSGKKGQGLYALVDAEDYDRVMGRRWYYHRSASNTYPYAASRRLAGESGPTIILLHRFVKRLSPRDPSLDHENRIGLDCRKDNLRLCTSGQNHYNAARHRDNKSGYKGVNWHKGNQKWRVAICAQGKITHLGYFTDIEAAARAYDAAASQLHKEFAKTNADLRTAQQKAS